MSREQINQLKYIIALIAVYAEKYGIGEKQAFNYLNRFQGLSYLSEYYDVLHTLSFEDAIESLTQVCVRNGGRLT